jgi:hypothetical protein
MRSQLVVVGEPTCKQMPQVVFIDPSLGAVRGDAPWC